MSARCTSEAAQQGVRDDAARSAITRPAARVACERGARRGAPRRSKLYSVYWTEPTSCPLVRGAAPRARPPCSARRRASCYSSRCTTLEL